MKKYDSLGQQAPPVLTGLFFFLLFLYPIFSFFWRRSYPLLSSEFTVFLILGMVFSGLIVVFFARIGVPSIHMITSLFVTIVVLIQFNPGWWAVLVSFALSFVLAWRLKARLYSLGPPVLIALILGAYVDSFQNDNFDRTNQGLTQVNRDLPPVLHIILDSFIGLDGLPAYSATEIIKEEAYHIFEDYGFRVYPRAYSRYSSTVDSLYKAMNFRNDDYGNYFLEKATQRKHIMRTNALFDVLKRLGYRFNVYQTSHLDFCQSHVEKVDRCWTYAHPNVHSVREAGGLLTRVSMLSRVILMQSSVLAKAVKQWPVDPMVAVHDPLIFSNLQDDLFANPGGYTFLAHVLLPHNPFVYLHDCSVDYSTAPSMRAARTTLSQNEAPGAAEVHEYRTMRYFEQMECALLSLKNIFDEMKVRGMFEKSIIVLHGDHGSGMTRYPPNIVYHDKLTWEDYRANYSTLFAVKIPGHGFAIDKRALPLEVLLENYSTDIERLLQRQEVPSGTESTSTPMEVDKPEQFIYLDGPFLKRVDVNLFEKE
ncbi:LTA synthase family protein [Gammaproteobacteria bacterium]|nr:LTA synthase family protein [Gammaproteobacteria bacterium]